MFVYAVSVLTVVCLSSLLFFHKLNKNEKTDKNVIGAIFASSTAISFIFPYIFYMLCNTITYISFLLSLLSIILIYIILVFICTLLVSSLPSGFKLQKAGGDLEAVHSNNVRQVTGEDSLYKSDVSLNEKEEDSTRLNTETGAIKSLVVEEIQNKMNLEECIDEAFNLKEKDDLEGAIIYYMYALDMNPPDQLVFWIVLDICVLYKRLGQSDLAKEILSSYTAAFGKVMDKSVRMEIERNLA